MYVPCLNLQQLQKLILPEYGIVTLNNMQFTMTSITTLISNAKWI